MLKEVSYHGSDPKAVQKRHPEYGRWDKLGLPILAMIYWTDEYVVYIDENSDIDFRMNGEVAPEKVAEFNRILNEASSLEISVSDEFPQHTKLQCKQFIGEAIACCLDQDFVNAARMLASARVFVEGRSRELSRMWYVAGCCLIAGPLLLAGLAVWFFRNTVILSVGQAAFWLILCAGAGALGALLSVISRGGTLRFDASSGKALHYFEGASRVVAGSISGVVVGIAVKSGLILTPLFQGNKAGFILLLSAIAAGAAERFATSIISDVSSIGLSGAKSGSSELPVDEATNRGKTRKTPRLRQTSTSP
ncbi:hypothetical protein [Bradyrhizobium sp. UFLA05-112]